MLISNIVKQINTLLAGEILSLSELTVHLDAAIDDINAKLNTKFPVFSELDGATEYIAIPDKYIRTVVATGAAYNYYTTDEEGALVAPEYKERYYKNLFYMERDYLMLVPEIYLDSSVQGTYSWAAEADDNNRGLILPSNTWYDI